MRNDTDQLLILVAGDNRGYVYDAGNTIKRLCHGTDDYPNKLFDSYCAYNLASYGVVHTTYSDETRTFTHEKHNITYPHEWPPSLFKDVVLFHLDMLIHLGEHRLTLKDALPENILLDGIRPVLVDFFSLIHEDRLGEEVWLMSGVSNDIDPKLRVLQHMFVPYMLVPLLLYAGKDFVRGRNLLAEQFCNNTSGKVSTWDYLPQFSVRGVLKELCRTIFGKSNFSRILLLQQIRFLCTDTRINWNERLMCLRAAVESLDVKPPISAYSSYYTNKGEAFGVSEIAEWGEKQRSIHDLLVTERPATVLDIGANTGWFSRLACSVGASVISTDVDFSSIDLLYREARFCRLSLTPLWLSFDDLLLEHYSLNDQGMRNETPFHIAAINRLKSDMVLCLGLLHHLVLGSERSLAEIFRILSLLTRSVLVLEYVDIKDELIESEPTFFSMLESASKGYCMEKVVTEGLKHFNSVRVAVSHPETRQLLFFYKEVE